ncbi:MAG: molybdopterin-dependent oxidoreductase [Myxococcota bacterium]
MQDDKQDRVVAARLKLKGRFEKKMASSPAMSDERPQGSGPPNRHGMPQVPVGQVVTEKWPVLDLGRQPDIPTARWSLELTGACDHPQTLTWEAFQGLSQVDDTSDFHCVTSWSRLDIPWRGVRFADLAALAGAHDDAQHVLCHAFDGYTTNLPLAEALKPDVLLAHTVDGGPLPRAHGGPVRMITPQLYAWKGAKWISKIEFLVEDQLGFWEQNGYSNSAHPWRNDRYA